MRYHHEEPNHFLVRLHVFIVCFTRHAVGALSEAVLPGHHSLIVTCDSLIPSSAFCLNVQLATLKGGADNFKKKEAYDLTVVKLRVFLKQPCLNLLN
jgi:hypothetical protein